jgi:oligopeptide/dipeptide ABC transporter ATP-binding protein
MIAMAIACDPALLIADEPTTALDVTVQRQILELLKSLQQRSGMALLLITHDLGVVAEAADRMCVMYAGRIVEEGRAAVVLTAPLHPYTRALLRSMPALERVVVGSAASGREPGSFRARLPVIPGEVPRPETRPAGCAFHPRCDLAHDDERCRTKVPPLETAAASQGRPVAEAGKRRCACWKMGESAGVSAIVAAR